jgi:hypothetical protein
VAQNDIINIDDIIDSQVDPILNLEEYKQGSIPQAIAAPGYYAPKSDNIIPSDFKNWLVDAGISPDLIDAVVGRPYGLRDRYLNLNPLDSLKDMKTWLFKKGIGMGPVTIPQFVNFGELYDPDTPEVRRARAAGIVTDEGAPYRVQKDAAYLPPDQYERGVKLLLKESYPNVNIDDFELRKEPRTGRLIYTDPIDGQKKFVQPPGVDFADVTSIMEPIMLEVLGGVAGFGASMTPGARYSGAVTGAGVGTATTAQLTDNPFFQAIGGAAGATLGTLAPSVTFTAMGEGLSHFIWRLKNLQGMKERGILDETYTKDKLLKTAMNDAGLVTVMSMGGNAAFSTLQKFLRANPNTLGLDEAEFKKAYEELKKAEADGSGAVKSALQDPTSADVAAFGKVGTAQQREQLAGEVEYTRKRDTRQAKELDVRLEQQQKAKERGYEILFEETGIDPAVFKLDDVTLVNQDLGESVFNVVDLATKRVDDTEKALLRQLKTLQKTNQPEAVFETIWKPKRVTNSQVLFDELADNPELQDTFRSLIYKDFISKTKDEAGNFRRTKLAKYLGDHGDALKVWYGDDFVDGLNDYNKLIQRLDVDKSIIPEEKSQLAKILNTAARAYVGIFTTEGRILTGVKSALAGSRRSDFEKYLLDPESLYKALKRKEFFTDPKNITLFRALGRAYGQEEGAIGIERAEPEDVTTTPVQERVTPEISEEELKELFGMRGGGEALIELKY